MSGDADTMLAGGGPVTDDHRDINPLTGQQKGYVVLTPAERAKGFVRPLRLSYIHVGKRPKHPLRELTPDEVERYQQYGYVKYEEYPPGEAMAGRFWTEADLNSGCGQSTKMSHDIAETYARDPKFYGGTFCATCRKHAPLEEFVWLDNPDQQVGS